MEFQLLSGQTTDSIYGPEWNDPNYQLSATEQYEDQQDEEYKYVQLRDTALYHDQDVNTEELASLDRELEEILLLY